MHMLSMCRCRLQNRHMFRLRRNGAHRQVRGLYRHSVSQQSSLQSWFPGAGTALFERDGIRAQQEQSVNQTTLAQGAVRLSESPPGGGSSAAFAPMSCPCGKCLYYL